MKKQKIEKMESLFHLIQHGWQEISPMELAIYQLARGNTFNTRVIGLDGIKRLKEVNPDCAVTFKPNHLSEADFTEANLSEANLTDAELNGTDFSGADLTGVIS